MAKAPARKARKGPAGQRKPAPRKARDPAPPPAQEPKAPAAPAKPLRIKRFRRKPKLRLPTKAELKGVLDWRGWKTHQFAYAGGLLMLIAGGASHTASIVGLTRAVGSAAPELIAPIFLLLSGTLVLVSNLGGTAVLIGGYLIEKRRPRFLASAFISVGAGLDLLGLLLKTLVLLANPEGLGRFVAGFFTTLSGLGLLFAVVAQLHLLGLTVTQIRGRVAARMRGQG